MIMSVWEHWLSVLICHVPIPISIKSTFLLLIRLSALLLGLHSPSRQGPVWNLGPDIMLWQAFMLIFKDHMHLVRTTFDSRDLFLILAFWSWPTVHSDSAGSRPNSLLYLGPCLLLCHVCGELVGRVWWYITADQLRLVLAFLLQTGHSCWGSVWPMGSSNGKASDFQWSAFHSPMHTHQFTIFFVLFW